jgi:hypothetical protein
MSKFQRLFLWATFVLCCVIVGDVSRGPAINGHFYFSNMESS